MLHVHVQVEAKLVGSSEPEGLMRKVGHDSHQEYYAVYMQVIFELDLTISNQ